MRPEFAWRDLDDAEALAALRRTWTDELDLVQVVDADRFRFDIAGHVPARSWRSASRSRSMDDRPIAYARAPTGPDDGWAAVTEVVLGPGARAEARWSTGFAAHVLATVRCDWPAEVPVAGIRWWLGAEHQVYDPLAPDLGPLDPPYAWYIRIPDAATLLRAIAPALESRLAASTLAGFDGTLTVDRWVETLRLEISEGRVGEGSEPIGTA